MRSLNLTKPFISFLSTRLLFFVTFYSVHRGDTDSIAGIQSTYLGPNATSTAATVPPSSEGSGPGQANGTNRPISTAYGEPVFMAENPRAQQQQQQQQQQGRQHVSFASQPASMTSPNRPMQYNDHGTGRGSGPVDAADVNMYFSENDIPAPVFDQGNGATHRHSASGVELDSHL